jgi:hypothetical protein
MTHHFRVVHPPKRQAKFDATEDEMYTLSVEEKVRVLAAMVEGNSIRSTERMTGVHRR